MRAWTGASLLAIGACSLIVPSQPEVIHCTDRGHIGAPACPARSICAGGVCDTCSESEACGDGVDNDCNGFIDDGCPGDAGAAGQAGDPGVR